MPAPTPIIRGQDFAEGESTFTWDSRKGGMTRRTFTGTQSQMVAKTVELQNEGYATELKSGPVWTLNATYEVDLSTGNGDPQTEPETTWEIQGRSLTRNILECTDRAIIAQFSVGTRTAIENKIKNPTSELPVVEFEQLNNAQLIEDAITVYDLMRQGVEGRQEFSQVVTRTITVSSQYVSNWPITNVGKIFSRERLISEYNVASNIQSLLPSSRFESYDNTDPNRRYYYGYLEQFPTVHTVTNNRVQIQQTWIYDKWTPVLYDVLS